jgi:hypothetical protein
MTVTTALLVPAGVLLVVDTWEPVYVDDGQLTSGQPSAWHLTLRSPRLNGAPIWRCPLTADLLDSAAEVIDGELRAGALRGELPALASL